MKLDVYKIKMLLAEQNMSQSDLAIKIGANRQQVNEILSRGTCTLKTLGRISKALSISVADIVKEEV